MDALPENYSQADRELVLRAYRVAEKAHEGQRRASGEAYIYHCVEVAGILAEMRVPPAVVAAGLLHDTVEDTEISLDDLRNDFGSEVAMLVDGVTKLTQLPRVMRGDKQENDDLGGADSTDLEQLQRSRKYDAASETLRKNIHGNGRGCASCFDQACRPSSQHAHIARFTRT